MRVLIIVLTMFLLTACAGIKKIETVKVAIAKPSLNLDLPNPLTSNDVEWIVINKDNYQEVFDKLTADGKQPVLFALTDKGYQASSNKLCRHKKSDCGTKTNYHFISGILRTKTFRIDKY